VAAWLLRAGQAESLNLRGAYLEVLNDAFGSAAVLAGRPAGTIVFSDELNHASIIDGLIHSRAEKRVFRHNDMRHLEELTRWTPQKPEHTRSGPGCGQFRGPDRSAYFSWMRTA